MGSKSNRLERNEQQRQGLAAGRENELYGLAVPGYSEFAKTGGISEQEKDLTRRQVASQNAAIFSRLKSALQRRARIQGGYAPGMSAQEAQLGRTASNVAGEQLTGANLGLLQQQRQGRLAGLGGLTGIMQGYQGEQIPLMGLRTQLEMKRRGLLGNISGGLGIARDVGSLLGGYGG